MARRPLLKAAVSWADAKRDGEKWISGLQLKKPAPGETWDLRPYSATLPFKGKYRGMVINAIRRTLKTRGIDAVLPE